MKIKREYKIAGLAVGGVLLLIFGLNYLKGLDLLQKRNVYHAVYKDISGISAATPVFVNGFKVGQVIGANLMPDGSGVVVSFQVNKDDLLIPEDTKVQIYSADLFSRAIKLDLGTSAKLATKGDTLAGDAVASLTDAVGDQIDPLKRKAESMLANIDSVLTQLQSVLNDSTVGDIDASFFSIRGTLESLNTTAHRLDAIIASEGATVHAVLENMRKVTANLDSYDADMKSILGNLDTLSGELAGDRTKQMLGDLAATSAKLKGIMVGLEQGEGSLGALLKNDTLYNNLESASKELDMLLEDIRINPNRYVSIFGKKDRLPKLSESDVQRIKDALKEDMRKP